jgi:hypothetical protein
MEYFLVSGTKKPGNAENLRNEQASPPRETRHGAEAMEAATEIPLVGDPDALQRRRGRGLKAAAQGDSRR